MTENTGKMRDWILRLHTPNTGELKVQGLNILDEIEREIAERYMELLLDADGVPIRVGDTLEYAYEDIHLVRKVVAVSSDMFAWESVVSDSDFGIRGIAKFHRHIKPRTVEDVLEDFLAAYDEWDELASGMERMAKQHEVFAKYANELRELMGVDE